jgi:hypothetical protein
MQGIPKSAPIEVKAKARQFKAYLVIFEQLMANFMTNLDSIKSLFSLRTDVPTSYSVQTLTEQQIDDLSAVYPTDAKNVLSRIVASFDHYSERKGRLLDYLLALYGERFSQNALRHFNYYCREDEVEQLIIANKVTYLESIVKLGRDRAAALDYSVTNEHPRSGLALRVGMLLGFEQRQNGLLTDALLSLGFELRSHHLYKEIKANSDDFTLFNFQSLDESRLNSVEQAQLLDNNKLTSVREYLENITETILVKNALLSERFLREGIYLERYCIAQFATHQDYVLTFKLDDNTLWQLGIYKDRASANLAANNLRQCLLLLNQASEGLHIIEHILLRPQQQDESYVTELVEDEDFFSFRLSVIFPSWTSRCHDEQFRTLAKETLQINAPAHISPEIYWLDFPQMLEFEEVYHHWMRVKSDKDYNAAELERTAQLLVSFLRELRNTQQTDI